MNIDHVYTTVFGAELDQATGAAMASGMPLEAIYAELSLRTREVGDAIIAKHLRQEAEACAA